MVAVTKKLRVEVWSDIACPWCYVGKRRLEAALEKFSAKDEVDVVWRAFELDPSAPRERDTSSSYAARLATKYGVSETEADGMLQRMVEVARNDDLDFRFDIIRPGNTFDAHRVLHLAHERGKQDAAKERFLRAYMTEGKPIGDPVTIVALAADAGLDADDARAVLASDRYASEVRADEEAAREFGITGVPFFVVGGKYAISGAQPAEILLKALTIAWSEASSRPAIIGEGATCGPDGCA